MPNGNTWQQAFPLETANRVAKNLTLVWERVAPNEPNYFKHTCREDKITERLWYYLYTLAGPNVGLSGKWTYEDHQASIDGLGQPVTNQIRKDITYFSDATSVRLYLIFEFKKLRKGQYSPYYGENGMRRFTDGTYALCEPLAAMVGMINTDFQLCVDGLKKSLQRRQVMRKLDMVADAEGRYVREPSDVFPGLAYFDTEHQRPPKNAPPNGTTTLGHFFLAFP